MLNRVWQAEEEKWERRRKRAEGMLAHIRELRRLEAEEEAEAGQEVVAAAGQPLAAAGQVGAAAGQPVAAAGSTTAPLTPQKDEPARDEEQRQPTKRATKDVLPELLREHGPLTMNALAEALRVSAQAVSNGLDAWIKQGVIIREPSTFPGHRYQFRLATDEERNAFVVEGLHLELL